MPKESFTVPDLASYVISLSGRGNDLWNFYCVIVVGVVTLIYSQWNSLPLYLGYPLIGVLVLFFLTNASMIKNNNDLLRSALNKLHDRASDSEADFMSLLPKPRTGIRHFTPLFIHGIIDIFVLGSTLWLMYK